MTANIDAMISGALAVLRGEVRGSTKFVLSCLMMIVIWFTVWTLSGWNDDGRMRLNSLQGRFHTLLLLGEEYKNIQPSASQTQAGNVDVAVVFAQVSENMSLGSRVNRITPDGRNKSVEINRLYAEEFADLQKQLASRGVRIIAAEIRALPAGSERLFTVSAIIGPANS